MRCQDRTDRRKGKKTRWEVSKRWKLKVAAVRTNSHLYLQILSGDGSYIVQQSSSLSQAKRSGSRTQKDKANALLVGRSLAVRSSAVGMRKVSFNRLGSKYHGHIKMMAEAARNYGLNF